MNRCPQLLVAGRSPALPAFSNRSFLHASVQLMWMIKCHDLSDSDLLGNSLENQCHVMAILYPPH